MIKWPTVSGCLHVLGTPLPKIGELLRLFALFYESRRQSQAVCTFWALRSRKLRNVSGYLHLLKKPMMKLAESLRLCAFHSRKVRNVSGFLHRHAENGRQFQAVCTFRAPHSRKLGNVAGYLHCFMKLAESLRLFALFVHSIPENCGTSQAICIF